MGRLYLYQHLQVHLISYLHKVKLEHALKSNNESQIFTVYHTLCSSTALPTECFSKCYYQHWIL